MHKNKTFSDIKKFFHIIVRIIKLLVLSIVLIFILLLLPPVQSGITSFVTKKLNESYGIDIHIGKTSISVLGMISLKEVLINDFKNDTLISAGTLRTSITNFNKLIKGDLYFGNIYGEDLHFHFNTYKGDTLSNLDVFINSFDDGTPPSQEPFIMKAKGIYLKNSYFHILDYNNENPSQLVVDSLFTEISDFSIKDSDIGLKLHSGSFVLDKHLKITDLKTDFSYTNSFISIDNTTLITPFSHIRADVKFASANGSYNNFLNDVKVHARIYNSKVRTEDIIPLYNGFSNKKLIELEGEVQGTLNNFSINNLSAWYQNTELLGNFTLANLFEENKPIHIKGDITHLASIYSDLVGLMPVQLGENLPEQVRHFGFFETSGTIDYSTTDLELDMAFSSQLGDFTIEGILSDLDNLEKISYKGYLTTHQLDLGKIIEQNNLGKITSNIQFVGKGLNFDKIDKIFVDGKIQQIIFNDYNYTNIDVKGDFVKQYFKGEVKINDVNLKMSVDGLAQLDKKQNIYDFIADIEHADLKALGFVKNDSIAKLKGLVILDVKGKTLDDITGKVGIHNTIFEKNATRYAFQDFDVNISLDEKKVRTILIDSPDVITGKVVGNFAFAELDKIFRNSIGSIYANYKPFKVSQGQYLSFDFKIYNKIIEIFLPEVTLGKNTFIRGNIVADSGDFKLNFKSPSIDLYGNRIEKINLIVDNKNPLYNTFFEIDKFKNSIYDISDFSLINTTIKDTLFFRTEFKGGNKKEDDYTLNFYHTLDHNQSSVVGLKKSIVHFKGKDWIVNKEGKNNRVVFDKKLDSIHIENFQLQQAEQIISIGGKMGKNSYKDIHLVFNKVELFDITPSIEGLNFSGALNGHLSLIQQRNKYFPSSDLVISNFTINDYLMGDLEMGIDGNEDLSAFKVNTQFINGQGEGFRTIGDIQIRGNGTYLSLDTSLKRLNLTPFGALADGILNNVRGYMTGSAHISGMVTNPKIEGEFSLEKAGMGVPYLNIDMDFDPDASISLKGNDFIFNEIKVIDVVYKTQAVLSGKIYHKKFVDWFLDLHLNTKNNRFLVLNTQAEHNELFYGTGFIKGKVDLTGNVKDIRLKVQASTADGTKFKIPLSNTHTVGDDSFIDFVEKKKNDIEQTSQMKTFQGFEMDFDLDILPNTEVEIIIDPKTGSNLIGKGAGTLLFEINTDGKFNMWGDFLTISGEYNFKYEGIIDKKFRVLPGGSITWNGDPLNAELSNLKAVYSLYANPSTLLESNQYNRKIQTQVEVSLEGSLAQPQTIFDINFPDSNSSLVSELNYRLKDTDKKQLQAFALLLQGNFLSDTSAGDKIVSYNMLETAAGIFNQLLSGDDDKLNLGLSYETGTVNAEQAYNTGDRLGITLSTQINERVLLNGKVGIPVGGVTQTAIAGDFEIQFLLNKDGTLSAKIFNRENDVQQYFLDKIGYTQGVGLTYRVDFNTFKQLIRGIFKRNQDKNNKNP